MFLSRISDKHGLLLLLAVLESLVEVTDGQAPGFITFNITSPPISATLNTGDNAALDCSINGIYNGFFEWRTYSSAMFGEQIYTFTGSEYTPTSNYPSDKYVRWGSYGLNISRVGSNDGALYACRFLAGDFLANATLVVIDKLSATVVEPEPDIIPANGTGGTSNVTTAVRGKLECTVTYGSPLFSDLQVRLDRMPQLMMRFNGEVYTAKSSDGSTWSQTVRTNYVPGVPRLKEHSFTMSVDRLLTSADSGAVLTCTVLTGSPSFALNKTTTYTGDAFRNWDITITWPSTSSAVYHVNDTVNCLATNHPNAFVHWHPDAADGHGATLEPVYSSNLVITDAMIGQNTWTCIVLDSMNRRRNEKTVQFNATEGSPDKNNHGDDGDDEENRRKVALGLGLGLGLGIPVIIILTIIAFFCWRKRNEEEDESPKKSSPKATPGVAGSRAYAPLTPEPEVLAAATISPPRSGTQPARRDASPVPSEEPSVNHSGHGDLGFRPAAQPSRTNSNMNTSGDRPLINLSSTGVIPPAAGFLDVSRPGSGSRSPFIVDRSRDNASALSDRSSTSSLSPTRSGGPTYRQPQPLPRPGQPSMI